MLLNFIFVIANILVIAFGFLLMKSKLQKLTVNKEILESIKKEINMMIVKLNETTVNNISLVEAKTKDLERLIRIADKKRSGLDIKIEDGKDFFEKPDEKLNNLTYSPQKIVKQSKETSENEYRVNFSERKIDTIDEVIKDLPVREKIKILLDEGFSNEDVRKKLKMSSGEFELILNIEGLR
ncbi:MAG TPA: hypothetical protein PLO89_03505 [Spirochaetota bacterium]|nr:hypothetical protein [Spirochaetota bacterium]